MENEKQTETKEIERLKDKLEAKEEIKYNPFAAVPAKTIEKALTALEEFGQEHDFKET